MVDQLRIGWTRGDGCSVLAEVLAGKPVDRLSGDIAETCIKQRIDLVVSRRMPTRFDVTNAATPFHFEPDAVESVAAMVAGGPHSELVVEVASVIGKRLGRTVTVVAGYQPDENPDEAAARVQGYAQSTSADTATLMASDAAELAEQLPEGALVVVGAPGGSLLRRAFFSAGSKLRARAPRGAVVVQAAPMRAFRLVGEPVFVSPHLSCGDAARLMGEAMVAVVDGGRLVGMARRSSLLVAGDGVRVGDVMIQPRFVRLTDDLAEIEQVAAELDNAPIPVVDDQDFLHGSIRP